MSLVVMIGAQAGPYSSFVSLRDMTSVLVVSVASFVKDECLRLLLPTHVPPLGANQRC